MTPLTFDRPHGADREACEVAMDADRLTHWAALTTALTAGLAVAVLDPGQPLFEQAMRRSGLIGPALQPLALLWTSVVVFAALVAAYAIAWAVVDRLAGGQGS